MKKVLYATLIASLAWLGSTQAQQATYAYSIKQCIEYAYANSSQTQNAKIDEEISEAKVREVMGIGLPQVNGTAGFTDYIQIPTTLVPGDFVGHPGTYIPLQFGVKYNATAGFNASQILFDGTYFLGLKASIVYKELSHKAADRSRQDVAVAVSKAYYNVLVSEERIKLLNSNLERIKKFYDDTKVMFENGVAEKLDFDRATLNYNNIQTEVQKAQQYIALGYYMLKFQMGMDVMAQLQLTDKLSDSDLATAASGAERIDYTKRVEYNLLKVQEKLLDLDVKRNQYARLPKLVGVASFSTNNYSNAFADMYDPNLHWYRTSLIGFNLTIPIIGGGQIYYKTRQARLTYTKAGNDIKNLERGIDLEVKTAAITYNNSTLTLETQKKNMDLANEVYSSTKIKFDQGVGTTLDIVTAEASLKEAQTSYYSSLYDALVAKVDLEKATGTMKY